MPDNVPSHKVPSLSSAAHQKKSPAMDKGSLLSFLSLVILFVCRSTTAISALQLLNHSLCSLSSNNVAPIASGIAAVISIRLVIVRVPGSKPNICWVLLSKNQNCPEADLYK